MRPRVSNGRIQGKSDHDDNNKDAADEADDDDDNDDNDEVTMATTAMSDDARHQNDRRRPAR